MDINCYTSYTIHVSSESCFFFSCSWQHTLCGPNIMLPSAGKQFLVRIQFFWRPFFKGRYLLLTNTLSGGGMLGLGDIIQQSWEIHKEPGRVRDWKRTGEMEGGVLVPCTALPMTEWPDSGSVKWNVEASLWVTLGKIIRQVNEIKPTVFCDWLCVRYRGEHILSQRPGNGES